MRRIALDLDGTLITCEARQTEVLRAAIRRRPAEVDPAAAWLAKREGASTAEALRAQGLTEPLAAEIADIWRSTVEEPAWLALDHLFPDTLAVLNQLREGGSTLLLVTARSHAHWVPIQLARLHLRELFDEVVVVPPATASVAKAGALKARRVERLVGDSEADLNAARQIGVPFVAIDRGQRSRRYLERAGATTIVSSLQEAV